MIVVSKAGSSPQAKTAAAGFGSLVFCGSRNACQIHAATIGEAMPPAEPEVEGSMIRCGGMLSCRDAAAVSLDAVWNNCREVAAGLALAVETAAAGFGSLVFCGSRNACQIHAATIGEANTNDPNPAAAVSTANATMAFVAELLSCLKVEGSMDQFPSMNTWFTRTESIQLRPRGNCSKRHPS
jgi:hypothetical protein